MNKLMTTMKQVVNEAPQNITRSRFAKFALLIALSFASYFFFSRLVVTAVEVQGVSMSPTLLSGDMVILNRFAAINHILQRSEMVVLKDPETGELVVKRIVGMPGDTVQVDMGIAFVNGQRLPEKYLQRAAKAPTGQPGPKTVVPAGHYYVLGDNRNNSIDSRSFGTVPRENIIGVINL
jgi:signal peptidase I